MNEIMLQLISAIIGIIIVVYGLNWWKYRHLFEVDLKKDMPFSYHWLVKMTPKERDEAWKKMKEIQF